MNVPTFNLLTPQRGRTSAQRSILPQHQSVMFFRSQPHTLVLDGRNEAGEQVGSGVYSYRFPAGDFSATRRMVIVK